MKKEVAGQPVWLWALGAAVVIGGYLYFSHRSAQGGAAAAPMQKSSSSETLKETITDMQGPPAAKHKHKKDGGDGG